MSHESSARAVRARIADTARRHLTPLLQHGGWSLAWGLFLAVALVVAVRPWLEAPDVYPEAASGLDTWKGYGKAGDFRAVSLLLVAGTVLTAASAWLVARVAGTSEAAGRRRGAAHRVLLVAALPAIAWLARVLLEPKADPTAPAAAALWLLAGHLGLWIVARFRNDLDDEQVQRCALLLLGGAFAAQFAGAGLGMLPVRLSPRLEITGAALAAVGWGASACVLVAGALVARTVRGDAGRFQRALMRVTLLCQLPLPLLFVGLIPPPFASPFGGLHNEARWPLMAFATACALAALAGWVGSWRSLRRRLAGAGRVLGAAAAFSPLPLAALAVFCSVLRWDIPVLPEDDWHFGERWITWQQWTQFGKVPYVDTMPTFGFYGPIVGTLGRLCFDSTIAGWLGAEVVVRALLAGGCCLGAFAVGGPAAAMFVALWPAFTDRLMMMAPCVLLLAAPGLLARPLAWLVCWPACCLLATAFNPASGAAVTLASIPVAAWVALRRARGSARVPQTAAMPPSPRRMTGWRSPVALAAAAWALIAVLASLTTPAWAVARGFLEYVRSNGELYAIHAGTAQAMAFARDASAPEVLANPVARLLWLAGWVAIAVVLVALLAREIIHASPRASSADASRVVLGWLSLGTTLLLLRWAVTRFGLEGWTRSGVITFTLLSALLAPLLFRACGPRALAPALAVLTALLAPFALPYPARSTADGLAYAGVQRALPKGQTLVHGSQMGLPMLGMVAVEDRKHLAALQDMRKLVDAHTQPGAAVFDLANRPALYAYTGRAMAARYSSGYYLGNDRLQRQVLHDLQRNPPAAVFFAPAITHGEGPATVRSYRVAKHLLLHYRPVERGDAVLLVPETPAPAGVAPAGAVPPDEPRGASDRLLILDRVVNAATEKIDHDWLGLVPAMWGRSWSSMAGSFRPGEPVRVTGGSDQDGQTWGLEFGNGAVAGRDVDFLRLEVAWTAGAADPRSIEIAWSTNGRQVARPLRCELPDARSRDATLDSSSEARAVLVVPVGSHPRWLLSPALEDVVVRPTAAGMLSTFRVIGASALRLRD